MNPHSIMRGLGAVLVTLAAPLVLAQDGPVTARSVAAQHLPRQADGHADLNGTWDNGSGYDFLHPEHLAGGSVCVAGCDAPAPAAAASAARAATMSARRCGVAQRDGALVLLRLEQAAEELREAAKALKYLLDS